MRARVFVCVCVWGGGSCGYVFVCIRSIVTNCASAETINASITFELIVLLFDGLVLITS